MTTPDHTLSDAEWIEWAQDVTGVYVTTVEGARAQLQDIASEYARFVMDIAARLAAVEAVRDHYAVLAGLPVNASDVVDRLDTALGGDDD